MKTTILGRTEVNKHFTDGEVRNVGPVDAIISLNDPDFEAPTAVKLFKGPKLILNFDDITHNFARFTGLRVPDDSTAPNEENVQQIIDFARENKDAKHILSHCHAGISRSSAAAIIFAAANGEDVFKFVHTIMNERPIIYPNRLMMDIAAGLLGDATFIEETNMAFLQSNHAFHDQWGDDRLGFDRWGIS